MTYDIRLMRTGHSAHGRDRRWGDDSKVYPDMF